MYNARSTMKRMSGRSYCFAQLNEVGGASERFGLTLDAFYEQNLKRCASRPNVLLVTSTYDTKRGEDVRARISVLSEMPLAWRVALGCWSRLNSARG